MSPGDDLERFPPQLLYHLLAAARRFEPDYYGHLCRRFHVDADRILGLFGKVEELGGGQLAALLVELHEHQSYPDIVFLAGRNAFLMAAQDARAALPGGGEQRFAQLLKQLLPPFLGRSTYHLMSKGRIQFIEVHNSVFARDAFAIRPLCGFYSGFFSECAALCMEAPCAVAEVRCKAMERDAASCLFQVAL
jgi:hypothetical protein